MAFPAHIFKAYDIRGLVEGELSNELAYRVGRAFVGYLRSINCNLNDRSIVVGYDMRPTSLSFRDEVIRGIADEGVNVVDIGLCSTPLFNFCCAHFPEYAGGIMVTASHNPAEYNGFKMTLENGVPVPGNNPVLVEAAQNADFSKASTGAKGAVIVKDFKKEYFDHVYSIVDPASIKPLKVVIDAANGMAAATFPDLLKRLPQVQVEYMYLEPDGTFPNHEANPLKIETLRMLEKRVVEAGADFGFALDGDADRIGLVDEKGHVVDASLVGTIVGLEVLKKHPGSSMLYDLRSSQIAPESWKAEGGKPVMHRVGHAYFKKTIAELGASYGSELSLHLYFKDMHGVESSDLCLLYILQILSESNQTLSQVLQPFKKYFHSGEKNFEVHNPAEVVKRIEEHYTKSALEISHIDGMWMRFEWGWVSVRAGNTEPVVRLNLETNDPITTLSKVKEFSEIIKRG